jgi:hypothetical protein
MVVAGVASIASVLIDLVRGTSVNWLALGAGAFCLALAAGVHMASSAASP